MRERRFGRTGWLVGEVGYGMWGIAEWSGSDDARSLEALQAAVDGGCTFYDTAWAYGRGHSERLLGQLLRANPGRGLIAATKVPPRNFRWPARSGMSLDETFPPDHIREYAEKSLANLGVATIDLLQLHVWMDEWATDERWQRAVDDLRREGLVRAFGISVNRWEPSNVVAALRTGLVDAVQVIYNVFDQAPEDELFPVCRDHDVAVIARVPFDEGSLTGTLTVGARWPGGDWRNSYFVPENLRATVERVERLRPAVPAGMTMAEMALRFVLTSPDVATVIPGMRSVERVAANLASAGRGALPAGLVEQLRAHRWDRTPTDWSQ